jgi:hypothetical protein
LGHTKIESTVRYLGIELNQALAVPEQVDIRSFLGRALRPTTPENVAPGIATPDEGP